MYKKEKKFGKMSGDRLVRASKMADSKIERAIKPLRLSKLKKNFK